MKKILTMLAVFGLAIPLMAQQTNQFASRKDGEPSPKWTDKKREKHQKRRLQLMERELKKIGITPKEKEQIAQLQKMHKEKMASNAQHTEMAREKLSKLLDEGAPMEVLEAAIQEVSVAQTEQLRILVGNRIEMERILGKEKYTQFMKNARMQYKKHGRRSGAGLPPLPQPQPPRPDRLLESSAPPPVP